MRTIRNELTVSTFKLAWAAGPPVASRRDKPALLNTRSLKTNTWTTKTNKKNNLKKNKISSRDKPARLTREGALDFVPNLCAPFCAFFAGPLAVQNVEWFLSNALTSDLALHRAVSGT